jgi:transposase-like protein
MMKKRKQFSPEQKLSILREHLVEKIAVSSVCDKHGIQPSMFYHWQKNLFENGTPVFASGRLGSAEKKLAHKVKILSEKLKRKDEVIAEVMEEHIALKKAHGEH